MAERPTPHVAMYIPSFGRGGIERFVVNASRELVRRDVRTDVLVRTGSDMLSDLPAAVHVVRLTGRESFESLAHRIVTPHVANAILALPAYVRYLRRESPTLLLSMQVNPFALIGARLARMDATLVIRESNTPSVAVESPPHLVGKLAPLAKRFTYTRANKVVAVSEDAAADVASMLDLDDSQVTSIYNPTYNERLEELADEPIDHPWFDEDVPVVVSTGRFSDQKDFETLLRAFAEVRESIPVRLLLLGDGKNRERLEALTSRLNVGESVVFVGYKDNPYPYMSEADLFVLSSHYEGLPNVLIEALGVGTPVVATDCPSGPREILLDGRGGELVPVDDVSAMADAIERSLTDTEETNAKLAVARDHLDRFTPERAVDEYLALSDHEADQPTGPDAQ